MRRLWEWLKALRRGERRVAPYGARGRVYEKKGAGVEFVPLIAPVKARGVATLVPTRVYRAKYDEWIAWPPRMSLGNYLWLRFING